MTGDQARMFEPTATDERAEETDKVSREDLPTPPTLIAAIFRDLLGYLLHASRYEPGDTFAVLLVHGQTSAINISDARPFRLLDVCCGYGAFAMMFARHWVRVLGLPREWLHITGVEIKPEREKHILKWCDDFGLDDWRAALYEPYTGLEHTTFDLIVGNPHFTALTHDDPALAMPPVLMRHAPNVALLHTNNALQRGEPGRAVERAYPPAVAWRVPGTVSFDGTSSVASDCYTVSLWRTGHEGPTSSQLLSTDPKAANLAAGILKSNGEPYACWRWVVPPGTDEPSPCQTCKGKPHSIVSEVTGQVLARFLTWEAARDEWNGAANGPGGHVKWSMSFLGKCVDCEGSGLDPNGDLPSAPGYQP